MGWILPAISTATSLLGAIQGNSAAKKQESQQAAQAAQQAAIQQEQLALSKELMRRGIATQVDANGNVTAYDQSSNTWKTVLSPTQQKIQDASDTEQLNQLQTDAPMSRLENIVNATRRSKEGSVANGVLANLQDRLANPVRGSDLASSLRLSRENAVNKGFDQVSASLGTQALRSGASGGGALAAALAKARSQQIAQTMGTPDVEGAQMAQSMQADALNTQGSLYNALASRAAGAPNVQYNPTNVGSNLAATLAAARSGSTSATGTAANINANAAGLNTVAPMQTSNSSLLGSIGTLLGSPDFASLFSGMTGGTKKKDTAATSWSGDDGVVYKG